MTSGSFRRHSLIQNNHGGKGGGRGGKSEGRKVIPLTRARHRTGSRRRPARGARRCPTLEFPESSSLPLALPHALPGSRAAHARTAPRRDTRAARGRAPSCSEGAGPPLPGPGAPGGPCSERAGKGVPGVAGGSGPPLAKGPARAPAATGGLGAGAAGRRSLRLRAGLPLFCYFFKPEWTERGCLWGARGAR